MSIASTGAHRRGEALVRSLLAGLPQERHWDLIAQVNCVAFDTQCLQLAAVEPRRARRLAR
jgi:hypothetical protein